MQPERSLQLRRQEAEAMKVVVLKEFGSAPEVAEIDVPEPGAGEVRVRIHAASVNGFDLSVANGYLKGMMEHRFPVVLGKDFAGAIDAVGPDVDGYEVGDRVFGVVTKDFLGDGSFAEYVTVPVAVGITKLPDSVEFTEAAGLGLAGTAAIDAFDAAGISEGTTVLIAGATGGVGQQALQLAIRAGGEVIATAHTDDELSIVRELGAGRAVDYTGDIAAQVLEAYPDGVDVVLHFAGPVDPLAAAVKPDGVVVSTAAQALAESSVRFVFIYANPAPVTLDRIVKNQAEQHTKVTVQRVYSLEQTTEAFGDFAAGTLGKLVISID
jgi:NADPH:quinone reductase-like Zn-dependent oxidoreductase